MADPKSERNPGTVAQSSVSCDSRRAWYYNESSLWRRAAFSLLVTAGLVIGLFLAGAVTSLPVFAVPFIPGWILAVCFVGYYQGPSSCQNLAFGLVMYVSSILMYWPITYVAFWANFEFSQPVEGTQRTPRRTH